MHTESLNASNPEHIRAATTEPVVHFDDPPNPRLVAITCCAQAISDLEEAAENDYETAARFTEMMSLVFTSTTDRFVASLLLGALLSRKAVPADIARDFADISKQALSAKLQATLRTIHSKDELLGAGIIRACISTGIITFPVGSAILGK